jgi:glucose/arabinose dehydrogenase
LTEGAVVRDGGVMTPHLRLVRAAAVATTVGLLLTGCGGTSGAAKSGAGATSATSVSQQAPAASRGSTASPTTTALAPPSAASPSTKVQRVLAQNVNVPWGIAFLPNGNALVSSRDTGRILRVSAAGGKKRIGTVPGVVSNGASGGEAGLLGLAVSPDFSSDHWLYAYLSSGSDNRVVRMHYVGGALGKPHVVLKGIPHGLHHNGGRIAFGPDRLLYVTTGESGNGSLAQQKSSLGGKILRMTATGHVPSGNPFPGSLVYSYGHRNIEGLAWDSAGRLWATEFGDHAWDELNLILAGHNYGWPATEGRTSNPRYTSPKAQWHTDEAGPSGIAIINDVAWIGGVTGHRLWRVGLRGTSVTSKRAFLTGTYGRLRTAAAAPDGTLWLTTSNTDHRAAPGPHDDRILQLRVS